MVSGFNNLFRGGRREKFFLFLLLFSLLMVSCAGKANRDEEKGITVGSSCATENEEICSGDKTSILICQSSVWSIKRSCDSNSNQFCHEDASGVLSCVSSEDDSDDSVFYGDDDYADGGDSDVSENGGDLDVSENGGDSGDSVSCGDDDYTDGGDSDVSENGGDSENADFDFEIGDSEGEDADEEDGERVNFGKICSGQTKCYNEEENGEISCPAENEDLYGQDGEYAALGRCIPQSFSIVETTVQEEKSVKDKNTKLEWQQTVPDSNYSFEEALAYCENLVYGGRDDWRVPNRYELQTIVDYGVYEPSMDSTYFSAVASNFWSSTLHSNFENTAWQVNFYDGYADYYDNPLQQRVRCVRGEEFIPSNLFETLTKNGDEIVIDSATDLIWQKSFKTDKTWKEALAYCENLVYGGHDDWRLPNVIELSSLVNALKYSPASDFPETPPQYFWSSSTGVSITNLAWGVDFTHGSINYGVKSHGDHVRCVRSEK